MTKFTTTTIMLYRMIPVQEVATDIAGAKTELIVRK